MNKTFKAVRRITSGLEDVMKEKISWKEMSTANRPNNLHKIEAFRSAVIELMRDYHIEASHPAEPGKFAEAVVESARSILL